MKLFQKYKSLRDYLDRFTLVQIGRLHIRIHTIWKDDGTDLYHSHPFSYCTIILKGGYDDVTPNKTTTLRAGSFAFRSSTTKHRIENVIPGTRTLFCTWSRSDNKWEVESTTGTDVVPGIYVRELYGRLRYSKFDQYWHRACDDVSSARNESRPSIDQTTIPNELITKL